jgi:hypothetical protein
VHLLTFVWTRFLSHGDRFEILSNPMLRLLQSLFQGIHLPVFVAVEFLIKNILQALGENPVGFLFDRFLL